MCHYSDESFNTCTRIYCKFCLQYNYEEKEPYIVGKFSCPVCKVKCFCQRCVRKETIERVDMYCKDRQIDGIETISEISRFLNMIDESSVGSSRFDNNKKKKNRNKHVKHRTEDIDSRVSMDTDRWYHHNMNNDIDNILSSLYSIRRVIVVCKLYSISLRSMC